MGKTSKTILFFSSSESLQTGLWLPSYTAPRPQPQLRPCHARLIFISFHGFLLPNTATTKTQLPMYSILGKTAPSSMDAPTLPRAHSFCDVGLVYLGALPLLNRRGSPCPSQDSRLSVLCNVPLIIAVYLLWCWMWGSRSGLCLQRTHSSFAGTWTVATFGVQGIAVLEKCAEPDSGRGWAGCGRGGGSSGWVE